MTAVRRALVASLLTAAFLAAGCAPTPASPAPPGQTSQPAPTSGGDPTSAPGGDPGGGNCPTVPQEGFELFSSALVTKAPADGQLFGGADHPVSWTFAEALEYDPDVDLYYVNEAGDAIAMGGKMLNDLGGNEWGTSDDVFWSDAADRPGFAILGVTKSAQDHEIVGVYCLTFKVAE
ncbi:MAG: hypothetical protein KIT69_14460 [Propionibacteriaceae bacterium]|nr:hypothetical protein [Propionibacteriaceae bacterium]